MLIVNWGSLSQLAYFVISIRNFSDENWESHKHLYYFTGRHDSSLYQVWRSISREKSNTNVISQCKIKLLPHKLKPSIYCSSKYYIFQ